MRRRQTKPKRAIRLRKNVAVQTSVVARAIAGESGRKIAEELHISRNCVARILSNHEVMIKRNEAKSILLDHAPQVAMKLTKLALAGDRQGCTDILRGLQILNPRDEHAFVPPSDAAQGQSYEEITFFLQYRRAPKDKDELAKWAEEHPIPTEIPAHLLE